MIAAHHPTLKVTGITKRFGRLVALDGVSLSLNGGSFHALLGENGAGKSTLAKCITGNYIRDAGNIWIDNRIEPIDSPRDAQSFGIGMVYQHFSLVPNMTVAENLVVARVDRPTVIDWPKEKERLNKFLESMPFGIDPDATAISLAAGEKQKVEILKELYLGHRILILDEPTTVLTPDEADGLFGMLRDLTHLASLGILLITHKFREVFKFADEVTVLRRGRVVASGPTTEFTPETLARTMIGDDPVPEPAERVAWRESVPKLEIEELFAENDRGTQAVKGITLTVQSGQIVGVAGVSGNGQRELVEVLAGQREISAGEIRVHREQYSATRAEVTRHRVSCLPEEPLQNACVRSMSVMENLAFRDFFDSPFCKGRWFLNDNAIRRSATALIHRYRIKTTSPDAPIRQLSGGNIQRTVLARELGRNVEILVAANPCFGLDVAAAAEIHAQIMSVRNQGAAVLLVSEDLDEILALSDRIVVIYEGRIVYDKMSADAETAVIGRHMAGTQEIGQEMNEPHARH